MNTLVEKVFGIMIFVFFFLPYTFGLYSSMNAAYTFNNTTTELSQMIKEDGGFYKGSTAYNYLFEKFKSADGNSANNTLHSIGYSVDVWTEITEADYNKLQGSYSDYVITRGEGSDREYYYKKAMEQDITSKVNSGIITLQKMTQKKDENDDTPNYYRAVVTKTEKSSRTGDTFKTSYILYAKDGEKFINGVNSAKSKGYSIKYYYFTLNNNVDGKVKAGGKILVDYKYSSSEYFGWNPSYEKSTVITSYKR